MVRSVGIQDTPLSVDDVLKSLDDEGSGGLVVFVGRVRDHDGGKGVTGLSYSAHPSALGRLQEVCVQVAEEYESPGWPPSIGSATWRSATWRSSSRPSPPTGGPPSTPPGR